MKRTSGAQPPGVVGIGASAGGIETLLRIVEGLPRDLPLPVCVVLHIPATSPSVLDEILSRRTALAVSTAHHGAVLEAGRVYVAPPDHHVLVTEGRLTLDRGPKQNGVRPAIDPLFRSIAASCGPRGVAVVLSGALNDGAAGAAAVAASGGTVVVQDPDDAMVRGMPEAALAAAPGARIAPAARLAETIAAVAEELDGARDNGEEDAVGADPIGPMARSATRPDGPPAGMTCPECHGPLWELPAGEIVEFRCRVGHAFSDDVLVEAKSSEVEAALWSAVEALEEQAELVRKVASRFDERGPSPFADGLRERATGSDQRAEVLRRLLAATEPVPARHIA